jgi:hypothetical protein
LIPLIIDLGLRCIAERQKRRREAGVLLMQHAAAQNGAEGAIGRTASA